MTLKRVVLAIVAALVAGLNQALGWHLSAADVAGVVVPLVMLIVADMHQESAQAQQYQAQLLGGLAPLLRDLLQTLNTRVLQASNDQRMPNAPGPSGDTSSTSPASSGR